jgi:O-antigen ligase
VNELLKFAEKRLSIFSLLICTGILRFSSYYNASEGSGGVRGYVASPLDRPVLLLEHGIYAASILLIVLRFKSVVRPALRNPFLWIVMALVVTSFIWSDFPVASQKYGLRALGTTLFGLYLASRYSLKEQLRMVGWALGIAVVISLLYTLAFPGSGIESGMHAGAWRGPFMHKNPFSRLMALSSLVLLLTALDTRRFRYVVWTVFAAAIAMVVLGQSTTALLVLATVLLLLPCYRALRWNDSIAVPFIIVTILAGSGLSIWFASEWTNILLGLGKDPTLSGRRYIWEAVLDKLWDRPWLGYGYRAFWQVGGGGDYVSGAVNYDLSQAHNGFLDLGVEIGLIGLSFFLLSFLVSYVRSIKWVRLGKTSVTLWPVAFMTFLPIYNYSESTNIESNSIFWVLFVAISLSAPVMPVFKFTEPEATERRETAIQQPI